ncbi:unnamed protein product [Prunus armeniaca]
MASTDLSPTMLDHLYSLDDKLKRGGPLLLLEDACENLVVGDEPTPKTTPYPCSISKGWSGWADSKLLDPSTCNILHRAKVLDAIFLSKLCNIHIEAKMLRHVVRRWSTKTHTFVCSWWEFTLTLEDVANISSLPVCENQNPFVMALTSEDMDKLAVLWKGAPTFPSTSLQFSNWVFLWEGLKRLDVYPLPYSHARLLADFGKGFYIADRLPLICKLLDNIEGFILCPYDALVEAFAYVPFYVDTGDTVEVHAVMAQGRHFRKYALFNVACLPCPPQGVPISLNHSDPFTLHRDFWSRGNVPDGGRPFVLAGKERVGGFSKGYLVYWNYYLASFRNFHASHCNMLLPSTAPHASLVSEEKAILLSEKRKLPFTSNGGEIVREFSKLKKKLERQSPRSSKRSMVQVLEKWKQEEEHGAERKQAANKPKRFIPKVAASGPSKAKGTASLEQPWPQTFTTSGSGKGVGKAPNISHSLARFTSTHANNNGASRTRVVASFTVKLPCNWLSTREGGLFASRNRLSVSITACPLIALEVIHVISNSDSYSNQHARHPHNIGLVNKYLTRSDFTMSYSLAFLPIMTILASKALIAAFVAAKYRLSGSPGMGALMVGSLVINC